jgi:hypothetical protein
MFFYNNLIFNTLNGYTTDIIFALAAATFHLDPIKNIPDPLG